VRSQRSHRGDRGVGRELKENGLPLGLMEVADYRQLEPRIPFQRCP